MAYYAIWITLTLLAQSAGMLRLDAIGVATCIGGVVASNVAFFMVFRSGLNQRLRDPGVTLQQLIVGLVWALVLPHATVPAARGLMLTALHLTKKPINWLRSTVSTSQLKVILLMVATALAKILVMWVVYQWLITLIS